jgi:hypothetical protein
MVTPSRPHRGHRLGLPWAARKWLLGARPYYDADEKLRNSGIVRLQHLIVKARTDEDWERYLRDLQAEWGPTIAAKRVVWRERKAQARERAKEARRRAREARREVAVAGTPAGGKESGSIGSRPTAAGVEELARQRRPAAAPLGPTTTPKLRLGSGLRDGAHD